jgi:hypothetical protein
MRDQARYGFDLVRTLAQADGLITSEGTIYPLLSRVRQSSSVTTSAVCSDATGSAVCSTSTTDKLHERVSAPYGRLDDCSIARYSTQGCEQIHIP